MHTVLYHDVLLRAVPRPCDRALEIGCGTGAFSRELALRSRHVEALDSDGEVIERARAASAALTNVGFVCEDFMDFAGHGESYDFVCALASLHHLPLPGALIKMRALLRPGGTLGIIGLYRSRGLLDFANSLVAFPVSLWLRATRPVATEAIRLRDPELSLREIGVLTREILPGAVVERRLMWRYTLVYREPLR